MDFYRVITKWISKSKVEIFPDFNVLHVSDLLVRGKKFYGVWNDETGLWSSDILDVVRIVDDDLWKEKEKIEKSGFDGTITVKTMSSFSSNSWTKFLNFLSAYPDTKVVLDNKIIFQNTTIKKSDYVTRRLPYALEDGDHSAWDEMVGTLYTPENRDKIEWSIGSIVSGDSKKIQKFCVFFGPGGTGKSTIMNIIQNLFEGYCAPFDAKALTSSSNQFSTEMFRSNPLVAIQHDGDLSRIEDNSKLNSIVSHEDIIVNEKGKAQYTIRANAFLFMGSNRPVMITDSKSGLMRRLIDIRPTGKKIKGEKYDALLDKILKFELGAIAKHCLDRYKELGIRYYDHYEPKDMVLMTNPFYNFVNDNVESFQAQEGVSLAQAYLKYSEYVEKASIPHKLPRYKFCEELKAYFDKFEDRAYINGERVRSWYSGFKIDKFIPEYAKKKEDDQNEVIETVPDWLYIRKVDSIFDSVAAEYKAQYANENGTPICKWDDVETKLSQLDTSQLHFVMVPENHIVIDFDLKDQNGEKNLKKNMEAASKWPKTYAEVSKSGKALHLHYIYNGDVKQLAPVYDEGIEVKVFTGNSSLRRKLTICNYIPIATLAIGSLPVRKGKKVLNVDNVKSEKKLRELIIRNLNKEIHGDTRSSCDFIKKILDDAYDSGLKYDVSDLRHDVFQFAMNSTNQSIYCMHLVPDMKWKSEEASEDIPFQDSETNVFFDIEVFPPYEGNRNGLFVNWKYEGEGKSVVRWKDPTPEQILELFKLPLIGFNNRRYDNHILYARAQGYTLQQLYDLSLAIVSGARDAFFGEAFNISKADVFDYSSEKKSLKKFEIELEKKWRKEHPNGEPCPWSHVELGLPWDQPIPDELVKRVMEYCDNDVIATEAVYHDRKADFDARQSLAAITGMTVNTPTNSLTTRFIFEKDKHPQDQFNYRFMGDASQIRYVWHDGKIDDYHGEIPESDSDSWTFFDQNRMPIFYGYTYDPTRKEQSIYRNECVGEGGYVYAEPGIYTNVALLDIASMHPSSIVAEQLFGEKYTKRFEDILKARIAIKHKDYDTARSMMDGKLAPYLKDPSSSKDLAQALKIAINSVYGLTSAGFDNAFRDRRNRDNIVAKRGALFMVNLKHEVQKRGFTVAHIKTDSIKIPNASKEIIEFVMDYGKLYGYTFEHEETYDRMCLVNDAVYIAKYKEPYKDKDTGDDVWWTATGTQFQVPYVFKHLFSREPIIFDDYCETKSVSGNGLIFLDMNEGYDDVSELEEEWDRRTYNSNHPDKKGKKLNPSLSNISDTELIKMISKGHNYQFVGRVGSFTPMMPGSGGGIMYRKKDDKYYAVTGTKGYRWMDSEMVRRLHKESDVDMRYFQQLVSEAIESIGAYGCFEKFVANEPYDEDESLATWSLCGKECPEDAPPWN